MKQFSSVSLFIVFCLLAQDSPGQENPENNFQRYTRSEGLSHNYVSAIVQDSIGYVWISTPSGLNRFNGSHFTQYHATNDSSSLAAEDLNGIAWIDRHRLAVYTAGIHIVDTRSGARRNLYIPYEDEQYEYKFNMIVAVSGDDDGNIYVLSRSGFYHFGKDYQLLSRFDYYKKEEVPVEHFFFGRDLLKLDDRRFLIVSIGGLYVYDKVARKTKKMGPADHPLFGEFLDYPGTHFTNFQFFQHTNKAIVVTKLLSDTLIYVDLEKNRKTKSTLPYKQLRDEFHYRSRIYSLSDTVFYLTSHYSGFFRFRVIKETGEVRFFSERQFPAYSCNGLLSDKDDNLWVATNKGLFRSDPSKFKVQVGALSQGILDSFPQVRLDDLYVSEDKVYAGTRGMAGLMMFDKQTLRLERQFFGRDSILANPIYSLEPIDGDNLMLGISGPVLSFNLKTGKETILRPPLWNYMGDWTSDLFTARRSEI